MKKNWKAMIVPFLSVVALGAGNILGLNGSQINSVNGAIDSVCTVLVTIAGLWGVIKSHDKKAVVSDVVKVTEDVADAVKKVEPVVYVVKQAVKQDAVAPVQAPVQPAVVQPEQPVQK